MKKRDGRFFVFKAYVGCVVLCSKICMGATYNWSGTTADLTLPTNWTPNGTPVSGDLVIFGPTGFLLPAFDASSISAPFRVGTVQFLSTTQAYQFLINRSGVNNNMQCVGGGIDATASPFTQLFTINQGTLVFSSGASADIGLSGKVSITSSPGAGNTFINITGSSAGKTTFYINGPSPTFTSGLQFITGSDAQQALINIDSNGNSSKAFVVFNGSQASQASISSVNQGLVSFTNAASAGSATISLNQSTMNVTGTGTTLSNAQITATNGSSILFSSSAPSAGSAFISLNSSTITFSNSSSGGSASIQLSNGSSCTWNQANTIGSINCDASSVINTNNALTIGSDNNNSNIYGNYLAPTILGKITKVGTGVLTLGGNNTYRGDTFINAGTVSVSSDVNLGSTSPVVSNITIGSFGTFQVTGTFSTARQITVSTGSTIEIASGQTFTVNTPIKGAVFGDGFTKSGSGTLNLAASNTYTGTTSINGGTLKTTSSGVVLGNVSLTNFAVFDISSGLSQTIGSLTGNSGTSIVLGSQTLTADSLSNTTFAGVISGTGNFIKQGTGTLSLSGINTYSGGTTISAGKIAMTGSGVITGSLTLQGTSIFDISGGPAQAVGDLTGATGTSIVLGSQTLTAGSSGNTTFAGVISGTGSFIKQGAGTLSLSGINTYSGGTTISAGKIVMTGSGVITGNFTLQGTSIFDISAGPAQVIADLTGAVGTSIVLGSQTLTAGSSGNTTFAGVISGTGSLIKQGTGTLTLLGQNIYSGGTTVGNGILEGNTTSLQGLITNNEILSFQQTTQGTFFGQIVGTGDLSKYGSGSLILNGAQLVGGSVNIYEGALVVNGTLSGAGPLTVSSGGSLKGNGTIQKNVTVSGTIEGGNSIGTLDITGNLFLLNGSMVIAEIDPSSADRIQATGNIQIDSGSSLQVIPYPGVYVFPKDYIILSGSSVMGEFDAARIPTPLLIAQLEYTPQEVLLHISPLHISDFFSQGNAGAVAHCLDELEYSGDVDLFSVVNSIRLLTSKKAIQKSLLQLESSQFTSLAIAQENDILYIQNTLRQQMQNRRYTCKISDDKKNTFWVSPLLAQTRQGTHGKEPGFTAYAMGGFAGFDHKWNNFSLGGGLGYTRNNLHWHRNRGHSSTNSGYAALYGEWHKEHLYMQGSILGGYSDYNTARRIHFGKSPIVDRMARGHHGGAEGAGYFQIGYQAQAKRWQASPFISADYLYLHENSFHEKGAKSLNLTMSSKNANLLSSQAGLDLAYCIPSHKHTVTPYVQLSVIRESRFEGSRETAKFMGSCPMHIRGYYPSRTLRSVAWGIDFHTPKGVIQVAYQGKFGSHYSDNAAYLEMALAW